MVTVRARFTVRTSCGGSRVDVHVRVIAIRVVQIADEADAHFGLQKQRDWVQVIPASGEFLQIPGCQTPSNSESVE